MALKKQKSQYAAYSFRERLTCAQWRGVIERCRVQRSSLAVRALAVAFGGSTGQCGYIRTYNCQLHHRSRRESREFSVSMAPP